MSCAPRWHRRPGRRGPLVKYLPARVCCRRLLVCRSTRVDDDNLHPFWRNPVAGPDPTQCATGDDRETTAHSFIVLCSIDLSRVADYELDLAITVIHKAIRATTDPSDYPLSGTTGSAALVTCDLMHLLRFGFGSIRTCRSDFVEEKCCENSSTFDGGRLYRGRCRLARVRVRKRRSFLPVTRRRPCTWWNAGVFVQH